MAHYKWSPRSHMSISMHYLLSLKLPSEKDAVTDNGPVSQVHRITVPPPGLHELPTPASAIAFDTQQELLWIGNEYVSYSMQEMYETVAEKRIQRGVSPLSMGRSLQSTLRSEGTLQIRGLLNNFSSMRRASSL